MLNRIKKVFSSRNERILSDYQSDVFKINSLEKKIKLLSDDELRNKTKEFKERLSRGETLDDLLSEAFAVVREASCRVLSLRHHDVQLLGGIALHYGKISEMRTGEGKTLVSTLPAYLNALTGKGVHIITVNDYLAKRDAAQMGKIHNFLGLSVGVILSSQSSSEKQAAYAADITYGTNNEYGFDYLRDNMASHIEEKVQKNLNYAIIDEVDSILIDEARTPLIISGESSSDMELYQALNDVPPLLKQMASEPKVNEPAPPGDFYVDEKGHQIILSEVGHEKIEKILNDMNLLADGESLYSPSNIALVHHVLSSLKAHFLYHRDRHYVVQDNEVIIVDEFTGRLQEGRRWSDGIHQAIEAKEGVEINKESQTLASITFQNYFRLYKKLSGMTGTADTEAFEFHHIYGLETVVIPPNKPIIRLDESPAIYKNMEDKWSAVLNDIKDCYKRGQPVLVGTTSIEVNEFLSELLKNMDLPHMVLNARQHASEATVIAQAGYPRAITIATNMAGRGTDIVLGGNFEELKTSILASDDRSEEQKIQLLSEIEKKSEEMRDLVIKAGGLRVIGTEKHEARRVDNQLCGRSGRQGDPGSSKFYLSLEDNIFRLFGGDRMTGLFNLLKHNIPDGEAIENTMVSRSLDSAQKKMEANNFNIRKELLEYDDVANEQRKVIYNHRNEILQNKDVSSLINDMQKKIIKNVLDLYIVPNSMFELWDVNGLINVLHLEFSMVLPINEWLEKDGGLTEQQLKERVEVEVLNSYKNKELLLGKEALNSVEHHILLSSLDEHWREHLNAMEVLRQGIHLRGYAQKNPKQEYKREAFNLFVETIESMEYNVARDTLNLSFKVDYEIDPEKIF